MGKLTQKKEKLGFPYLQDLSQTLSLVFFFFVFLCFFSSFLSTQNELRIGKIVVVKRNIETQIHRINIIFLEPIIINLIN